MELSQDSFSERFMTNNYGNKLKQNGSYARWNQRCWRMTKDEN